MCSRGGGVGMSKNCIDIRDKTKCTGCGACRNVCPRDAITMVVDEEGFPYPIVAEAQCIDCGRCVQICPLISPLDRYGVVLNQATVYAAWSKDEERRIQSTSGGLFSELALHVYDQGGIVVGAVYGEAFMIHHEVSERADDLLRLRQSKYAQSDIRLVFREIKRFLDQGRPVLFCGTPCQAAGLRSYLGGVSPRLLLCDFICRGVNSPKAYRAYLDMLMKQHGASVTEVQFKNKDFGWNCFHTKVTFSDGSVHALDRYRDPYMQAYLKYNLIIRPCCHVCMFKGDFRNTDITLGDFWGVGKFDPTLDDDKGTSVVIVNTEKGGRAIAGISGNVSIRKMSVNHIQGGNHCLTVSAETGRNRAMFFGNLDSMGFEKAMRRSTRQSIIHIIRAFLRKHL